jgi:hypothetical protein
MDRPPLGGDYPTSYWEPGEVIQDNLIVPLSSREDSEDKLLPGELWLRIGLYRSDDGLRLPVLDSTGQIVADAVTSLDAVKLQ